MSGLPPAIEAWITVRPSTGSSHWTRNAWSAISDVVWRIASSFPERFWTDRRGVLVEVDEAYPFGERLHWPYKCWLVQRRTFIDALDGRGVLARVVTQDERDACEVASDLVELGRADEALALLDLVAPSRLDRKCPACGARVGKPCFDLGRAVQNHIGLWCPEFERVVPHAARMAPPPIAPRST
jgi:hypothetical protein